MNEKPMFKKTKYKSEAKYQKSLHQNFKKQWQKVRAKIRRIKTTKAEKGFYIEDVKYCNQDLIDVLVKDDFNTIEQLRQTINDWLELEYKAYGYSHKLEYKKGQMAKLMQLVTLQHRLYNVRKQILNTAKGE